MTVALPVEIAAGPDPRVWPAPAARSWVAAGIEWSRTNLGNTHGWRKLLSREVRYAVSSIGRANRRAGSYLPPWERS